MATFVLGATLALLASTPSLEFWFFVTAGVILLLSIARAIQAAVLRVRGPRMLTEPIVDAAISDFDWDWSLADHRGAVAALRDPRDHAASRARLSGADRPAGSAQREQAPRVRRLRCREHGEDGSRAVSSSIPSRRIRSRCSRDGTWKNAQALTRFDIAPNWGAARGIYVSVLAGGPMRARVRVIEEIRRFIGFQDALPTFARPGTPEGRRIMRHHGLRPLHDEDGVWVREARKEDSDFGHETQKRAATPVGMTARRQVRRDPRCLAGIGGRVDRERSNPMVE
ncbi:MAG: hypothetical protein WDM88_12150 [Galbitalea sp.]